MKPKEFSLTYCNPIPLPDYPRGRMCRPEFDSKSGWLNNGMWHDFRETADPSVLYHDNKWFLYPSAGMAWVSEDFVTWKHVEMNLYDIGYAPTIMKHRGLFYLNASDSNKSMMYVSKNPLGPWKEVGPVTGIDGKIPPGYWDPMFFSDDDDRVYLYYGCGGTAIRGLEMNSDKPNMALTEPKKMFSYNPNHEWERFGEFNQDPSRSWVEGAWMFKNKDTYYLTYCAPGTQFATYGMGCYISKSPLGPFKYQKLNPILRRTDGLVRGPGHGCIVRGPKNTIWAFYTCLRCYYHVFERRIGFDPAGFDSEGNLFVHTATDIPQWAPGILRNPQNGNDTGLKPVSICHPVKASSEAPGRPSSYANDYSMRTWWEADKKDSKPWIEIDLGARFTVSSMRIIWAEPNLDYKKVPPGPFKFKVECKETDDGKWKILVDKSRNLTDMHIDYITFSPKKAKAVSLSILGAPKGIGIGIVDFSVFGTGEMPPLGKYG
ncbi:MAG: hypothetical protein A2X48_09765 [Lentisphaerae bacterium GWF2_49_21]|nr:MAG: hypothetical protein A2X48_09765 [Lentisphaerae bacterium GWF2_49_21]